MLRELLTQLKAGTVSLNYGRDTIAKWASNHAEGHTGPYRVLDLGMGSGFDLQNIANSLNQSSVKYELYGLDSYAPHLESASQKNITGKLCNIETEVFPFPDQHFDLIIANQVIEHTKEIFWIYSEASRLLKPGGTMVTGVPNIASFHNRIGMLFGIQPTNIELLGPHVRGFTADSFKKFIETDQFFEVKDIKGGNFYPFPKAIAQPLSRLFP